MTEASEHFSRLTTSVLNGCGDLSADVRRAIEARSAEFAGRPNEPGSVPGDLAAFVEKVALHAYKTTDADIERLKQAGYSEDAIFEVIVAAALGAGRVRYERGMAALKGEI